jgi:tyrosyl-tRNA synthetase
LDDVQEATMTLDEKVELLSKHAVAVTTPEEFRDRLKATLPLRVKMGFDPTSPDLHLGHMVGLRKLRQFQDLGHMVTLIIGDFTAAIGDPTGRNAARPSLDAETIKQNSATYLLQASQVLDPDRLFVRRNSHWLEKVSHAEVIGLMSHVTVQQALARDDFANRLASEIPVGLHETLYPLLQAYDSVVLRTEVEIGGSDQLFNLMMGRKLQREMGQQPQICMTLPILEGTDGMQKMSKSLGNYIGLAENPTDQFGKIMSIPDKLMVRYFDLLTDLSAGFKQTLLSGHPMTAKKSLAYEIVCSLNGSDIALAESRRFEALFEHGEPPEHIHEIAVRKEPISRVLHLAALTGSRSDSKRLIEQGAVYVDGKRIEDPEWIPQGPSHLVKVGKRRWARLTVDQG